MQYLSKKNIKVFLDTCRSHFGLTDADLFLIPDLFDGTNFVKVKFTCCCEFCNYGLCLWLTGLIRFLSHSTCWALLADDLWWPGFKSRLRREFQLVGLMAGML